MTPHRGRLLELPGAVLSGQWETRLVKDKSKGDGDEQSIRISLRHESSSLRSLEPGHEDDSPDEHFVSILKPATDRTHSLIHHGVVLEEEIDVDHDGREQISNSAFIGCVSLVLFEGFLSSSEAIGESRDVASAFLKNCVPNELQSGRELYGVVGNEHNSKDDENITGMLYPCKVSVESDHVVLLLHNEEFQISGIDVIFRPKESLRQHTLTEVLLDDHMHQSGSDDGEIMKRYIEKNIVKVLRRPSPLRPKAASVVSHDDSVQSEEKLEECSLDHQNIDNESHGFGGDDQPDFDANNDDLSSVRGPKEDENVQRLEEESRSLKQRIQRLEEEKRLLEESRSLKQHIQRLEEEKRLHAQQIVDESLVENDNIASAEYAMDRSAAEDGLADDPVQIEPVATTLTASAKSKKKAFVDLFGDNDTIFDELTTKQVQVEPATLTAKTAAEKKAVSAVKDLFGDSDSLFGVSTKKQINRRKSTGGMPNPRASFQKQNRGRQSTGGLPNRRESLGKANSCVPATAQVALVPASKPSSRRTSTKQRYVSTRQTTTEKVPEPAKATTDTRTTLNPKTIPKSVPSVRTKTKKPDRRSTFPIESRGKLRFSTGTNASISMKNNVTARRKKVNVADLFEDDSGLFGCAPKIPSVKKKASMSKSIHQSLISNDAQSISSFGGGSCSFEFESLSTQPVGKVPTSTNAARDGIVTSTQPFFDVYFGKQETSNGGGHNGSESILQQAGTQPFFDYYYGQDLGKDGDESTQYAMQPFHSVFYGQVDDEESTMQSITSTFEMPTVSPSLYYFGLNEGIEQEQERIATARPPCFDHYYGQANDEESSTLTLSSVVTSLQSPAATSRPPFYDHFYGQESVRSLALDVEERTNATAKTSWRSWFATCAQLLVIGVLPALIPAVALLISKQNSLPLEVDVNDIFDETTSSSWWSLKPWE